MVLATGAVLHHQVERHDWIGKSLKWLECVTDSVTSIQFKTLSHIVFQI
jgi:hypothetical protein